VEREAVSEPLSPFRARRFQPPNAPNIQLQFISPGQRLIEQTAENVRAVLEKPPHRLEEAERRLLLPVLRDLADQASFNLESAQTWDLNGRRVLCVEGRWLLDPFRSMTLFVDIDGSAEAFEEIVCVAPADEFEPRRHMFEQILQTVEWNA
jgi:hypothetical protein